MYSIIKGCRIVFSADRSAVNDIIGIDMQAKMPILFMSGEYVVFKRNGFTGWSGVGFTDYYPPDYYLIRVKDGVIIDVVARTEADRKTWRKIRADLIEQATKLANDLLDNE